MKKYAVLLNPSEDQQYGTQWHLIEAHSPQDAVAQIQAASSPLVTEATLVIEVAEDPTVVVASTSFEIERPDPTQPSP